MTNQTGAKRATGNPRLGGGRRRMITTAAATVALWVVASIIVPATADEADFTVAWEAADAARQRAAELGHEWRDTAEMLEQAKALAAAGDYGQAMQLVGHAQMEGERGAEQAEQQAASWQDAVPK